MSTLRHTHDRAPRGAHRSVLDAGEARAWKPTWTAFLKRARPLPILTAPIIYSFALPLVVLDLWVTIYQWICFPVYGLPRVRRRDYIAIDRHRLGYLHVVEKAHCLYCSYANGLLAYVREIAARTERYWCPIQHARPIGDPHAHYDAFFEYGDARNYRQQLDAFRARIPDAIAQSGPRQAPQDR